MALTHQSRNTFRPMNIVDVILAILLVGMLVRTLWLMKDA